MRKKSYGKKILSLILSLAMTLPFGSVFAQEENTEILDTSQENEMKFILFAENDIHIETNIDCFGNLVSNNSITFKNSTYNITGSCTSETINKENSQGTIASEIPSVTTSNIPNLTKILDDEVKTIEATAQAVQLYARHKIDKSEYGLDGISYIVSDLSINGLISAKNDISIHSASVSSEQTDFAILYSQNGDINLSSSQINYNGIIYAPNGTVTMNSSKINFSGIIIAKNVTIFSSECTLSYHNGVEKYLPKQDPEDGQYEDCYEKPLQEDDIVVDETTGLAYTKNQIVLMAKDDVKKEEIAELMKQYNGAIVGYLAVSRNYQIEFTVDKTKQELEDIVLDIQKNNIIKTCSIHSIFPVLLNADSPYTPNDPWDEEVTWDENSPRGNNWGLEAINARGAWKYRNEMQTVKVGIIDGKYLEHEDIGKVQVINDKYWKDPGEDPKFEKYHATQIAGIIGATHNNKIGISGVAPNVELYNTPFLSQKVRFHQLIFGAQEFTILMELETLIVKNKVKVINFSVGNELDLVGFALRANGIGDGFSLKDGMPWSSGLQDLYEKQTLLIAETLTRYIGKYDFLIVQAAGNHSSRVTSDISTGENFGWIDTMYNGYFGAIEDPELKKRIIVVGALKNENDGKYSVAEMSNVGTRVDIFAPGYNVCTTKSSNEYELDSGTSFAAPHVTGVAAMVWGINPQLTGPEVKDIIVNNRTNFVQVPKKHPIGTVNHVSKPEQVFNKMYPIVNAESAVQAALKIRTKFDGYVYGRLVEEETGNAFTNAQVYVWYRDDYKNKLSIQEVKSDGTFLLILPFNNSYINCSFSIIPYRTGRYSDYSSFFRISEYDNFIYLREIKLRKISD